MTPDPAPTTDPTQLRVGLIGYGLAGSAFHAPLVEAVPGLRLASIVTAGHAEAARAAHPEAEVVPSADDLFADADSHDLLVIAAPNRAHFALAMATIEAGLHVVVDKPLAATVADGERVAEAARARGVVASVFHNRRWDGDFLTLRRLMSEGALGEVVRLESRFDRWRPEVETERWREAPTPEDAGGMLFDIGPHLIDQALELLGPARSVYAEVRGLRPGAAVDDDFFLALDHEGGAVSHLSATMVAAQPGPRFHVLGTRGAYVKHGLDVQEDALREGASPGDPGFGEEPRESWGALAGDQAVPTEAGRYVAFYEEMERAIRTSGPPPVPLEDGVATLRIIEAARESADRAAVISL